MPEAVVRRRFDRSVSNFFREYQPLVDSRYLLDNTSTEPIAIAFKKGSRLRIIRREVYQSLIMHYGAK